MQENEKRFSEAGAELVALSVDEMDESKALVEKLGLTFPLLGDPERKIVKAFGVFDPGNEISWPAVFVIDKAGKIVWRDFLESYKKRVTVDNMLAAVKAAGA